MAEKEPKKLPASIASKFKVVGLAEAGSVFYKGREYDLSAIDEATAKQLADDPKFIHLEFVDKPKEEEKKGK